MSASVLKITIMSSARYYLSWNHLYCETDVPGSELFLVVLSRCIYLIVSLVFHMFFVVCSIEWSCASSTCLYWPVFVILESHFAAWEFHLISFWSSFHHLILQLLFDLNHKTIKLISFKSIMRITCFYEITRVHILPSNYCVITIVIEYVFINNTQFKHKLWR